MPKNSLNHRHWPLFLEDLGFINNLSIRTDVENRGLCMRRSKLESYEAILSALVKKPLTIDRIAYETDMDCAILKQRLDFLQKNDLVEERTPSKKTLYAITEKGMSVLKTLSFQKYFEKVANTIRMVDEALQVLPVITGKSGKEKETESR
jgi:predicted transcriptional regulator